MGIVARSLAVGASVALHAAVAAALLVFARDPLQRALQAPGGAVEVGVIFTEPRRPAGAGGLAPAMAVAAPSPSPGLRAPRPAAAQLAPRPPEEEPSAPPETATATAPSPAPAAGSEIPGAVAVSPELPPAPGGAEGRGAGTGAAAGGVASGVGASAGEGAPAGGAGAGAGPGGGGGEGGAGPDVDRELRSRLAASAARCYPRAARRFRAEGTAKVRFCVGEDGRARDEQIVESSGQSLLDEAALRCVIARAAPFPRTASCFTVPIHFFVP